MGEHMSKKHFFLTGGTGFIGQVLVSELLHQGHQVTVCTRNRVRARERLGEEVELVQSWDGVSKEARYDWVINLAGEGIADRPWTEKRKQVLRKSRVAFTNELVQCLCALTHPPKHLITASAIGFYGDKAGAECDEQASKGAGFAADLCADWEAAATAYSSMVADSKVYVLRLGIVLGVTGGFFKRLLPTYKFGLGAVLGSGEQAFPWVHVEDVAKALCFISQQAPEVSVLNLVAPEIVSQKVFTRIVSRRLHRPVWIRVPAVFLRKIFREQASLFLDDVRVLPSEMQALRYVYKYPKVLDIPLSV